MPKYRITYSKSYKIETDSGENDAIGIADQEFTDDIREMLSESGSNKIMHLFKFKVEKIEKNGEIEKKIEERQ